MNKTYVYAIYSGSVYEGGGVIEIYADKEKAIKFAIMLVEKEKKSTERIHKKDMNSEYWKWSEKENGGSIVKCWANPVDEIIVYEYNLIQ